MRADGAQSKPAVLLLRIYSAASVVKDSFMKRFGISTHLYHGERLKGDHLTEIASHGFEAVELLATKSHFDYHDPRTIGALAAWLRDAGLEMPSVHAPIVDSLVNDTWGHVYSTATRDEASWRDTMSGMRAALDIARHIPFTCFVLQLRLPAAQNPGPLDSNPEARS